MREEEGERNSKVGVIKDREVTIRRPLTVFFISKIEIIIYSMGNDCEG